MCIVGRHISVWGATYTHLAPRPQDALSAEAGTCVRVAARRDGALWVTGTGCGGEIGSGQGVGSTCPHLPSKEPEGGGCVRVRVRQPWPKPLLRTAMDTGIYPGQRPHCMAAFG